MERIDEGVVDAYCRFFDKVEDLSKTLKEEDVIPFDLPQDPPIPVAIAVDGGQSILFREHPFLSIGLVRVSASPFPWGGRGKELRFPPVEDQIAPPALLGLGEADGFRERAREAMRARFSGEWGAVGEILQVFSRRTKIGLQDLGTYYQKDLEGFTRVLREVLEWAYMVWILEGFSGAVGPSRLLLIKDGRLAQTGVENSFRKKLKDYFAQSGALIVGVSKRSRMVQEGLISLVISEWLEDQANRLGHGRFLIRVPEELMKEAYKYERQWNAEAEQTFSLGRRYVLRLFEETLEPGQAVAVLDIPERVDEEGVKTIGAVLKEARSALFGGSVGYLQEAHGRASIGEGLSQKLRRAIMERLRERLPEERWWKYMRILQV
ncbi:hypothetical protein [Thermus oshimai]|uniref:hypothetical protein n=1 Tax=Thermus oshimai TaxID=56957 RepID=UPI0012DDBE69|nr:hypothetical protein [Thermus oshimai]